MLSYLMVKDNMQFKNNSVAKYLPVGMFGKYSEILDNLVKGLVTKNTSMNLAEVGYNFRKMYVTGVNTSYGAMQIISLSPKDNTPVRLNGKNLEFAINTESVASVKSSNSILSEIFSKLLVKKEDEYSPAFKFPQFIKVRIGNDQYKVYELDSFTNNAKGFTNKKDNFLNYIDASQGVKHNLENAYAAGEKATYKPLDQIGVKDVSVFFPGTYDKAKELFDQVKPEEVNTIPSVTKPGKFTSIEDMGKPTTPIEQSIKVNPYAMTSELANDISTEVNASEVKLPEEKPLNITREYTSEKITSLKSNEVFVFGANTVGGHGGGTAGLAQRGSTSSNYTALPIGTKGKWSEYGIVDKLMQGTEGKSFGIVTKEASISGTSLKIGPKRSVSLNRIEQSINALIKTANENPNLKFLVTKFGTNMAGFSEQEMKSLLENKNLPDNIILPKEFEVRENNTLKVEEKDVTLDAKKNLLAMVNSQELFIEGKEFTEVQYQKLRDRINAAKTMNELIALEENITKCM